VTVLRDILAHFGVSVDAGPLEDLDKGIGSVVAGLQGMAQTLAGGFAVTQLTAFVGETVQAADDLGDLSERLGVSADSLETWGFAAQLSGLDAESMSSSLGFLQRSMAQAVTGNATARQAFNRLGVDITDAEGRTRDLDAVLLDVAGAVAATEDPARRAALAQSVFGRSGAALVPLLSRGAEGLAELRAEYQRLGGGASRTMIERSSQLSDNMARLDVVSYGLRTRLVNLLLPSLIEGTERTLAWGTAFVEAADKSHILEAGIVVLGAIAVGVGLSVAAAWAGPILIFAAVSAAVLFLILLVDDLITMFNGGTSVIGGFLDEIYGVGAARDLVDGLTESWRWLAESIGDAYEAVTTFLGENIPMPDDYVGDERVTSERGFNPETAIGVEESERRAAFRRDPSAAAREGIRADVAALGRETGGTARIPGSDSAPVSRSVTNTINSALNLTVNGGDPNEVRRVAEGVLDERNRAAVAALSEEAAPRGSS
jgi:hypothetical protein